VTELLVYTDKSQKKASSDVQNSSGIGVSVKVIAAPTAGLAAKSIPKTAQVGKAITLKAEYTANGKPVKKGKVEFWVSH